MKLTLIFSTLAELNLFMEVIKKEDLIPDYKNISVTGNFEENEIVFAEEIFQAVIIKAK